MATLELLDRGLTPLEVAKERGVALSTVETHMAELVLTRKLLDVDRFLDPERKQRVLRAIRHAGDSALKPIKDLVGDDVSYGEIRLIVAEFRVNRRT